MIFTRSTPTTAPKDYTRYRLLLRSDFQVRLSGSVTPYRMVTKHPADNEEKDDLNDIRTRVTLLTVCAFFGGVFGFKSVQVITNVGPSPPGLILGVKAVGSAMGVLAGLLIGASLIGLSMLFFWVQNWFRR